MLTSPSISSSGCCSVAPSILSSPSLDTPGPEDLERMAPTPKVGIESDLSLRPDPPVPVASPPRGVTGSVAAETLAIGVEVEDLAHGVITVWTRLIKLSRNDLYSRTPSFVFSKYLVLASIARVRKFWKEMPRPILFPAVRYLRRYSIMSGSMRIFSSAHNMSSTSIGITDVKMALILANFARSLALSSSCALHALMYSEFAFSQATTSLR